MSSGGTGLAGEGYLGQLVSLDPSWADSTPRCYVCGQTIPWNQVVCLPGVYSCIEDDDPDHLIPIHKEGCLER